MTRVVVVYPPNRRPYETCFFSNFASVNSLAIVDENVVGSFEAVRNQELVPSRTKTGLLGRLFKTTASSTSFLGAEKSLKDSNAIITVEAYSPISKFYSEYAKENGIKSFVVTWETIASHPFYLIPPFSMNASKVFRLADGFIATSARSATHLEELGVPKSKVRRIYPGVDTQLFRPIQGNATNDGPTRLLYVGLLSKHKGFDILVDAFEELRSRYNVVLTVVGDGPLRRLVESGRAGIEYHGPTSGHALAKTYAESSIFVSLPQTVRHLGIRTWEEQFGFTLVEAMSCGLPIVASDCGAVAEILGPNNIIIRRPSLGGVVEAISSFISKPTEMERVGAENRRRALEKFDSLKQSREFEAYLESEIGVIRQDR